MTLDPHSDESTELSQKEAGAYYTPSDVAAALVKWVVRTGSDRLLDPSCGDGRFIAHHSNSVGIEQSAVATRVARERAPASKIHRAEFFSWAAGTPERFDAAAGNPPFIRYQMFKGETRDRALAHCRGVGAEFSRLTSSWAPFLVVTASLLRSGGRMAFVVPAEIGHAPYAAPLLEYLVANFKTVHIVAVRNKLFPDLSEDCWLLYADGFGRHTDHLQFTAVDTYNPKSRPPPVGVTISVTTWRSIWKRRLRPFLMSADARDCYHQIANRQDTARFGDVASIGIGYVSGDNDFFHLRPSVAANLGIPLQFLQPTVRNGRALPRERLTKRTVDKWRVADEAILLLRIPKTLRALPRSVLSYLDTDKGKQAKTGYKCSNREPWYSVPDVKVPDFFLTYMSGKEAALVSNDAGCTCTNSVHSVTVKKGEAMEDVLRAWASPFVNLSCEIEGHPLGGGMLKLEPREACEILVPSALTLSAMPTRVVDEAVNVMRSWRHYGDR